MEQEEETRGLEVKGKFKMIKYMKGVRNSTFCTYQGRIYFFPSFKNSEVWSLDVETQQSSLFFSL